MSFLKFLFAMFLSFLPGIFGIMVSPISTGQNIWYNSLYNSAEISKNNREINWKYF